MNAALSKNPNQVALLLKRADIHRRYQHFDKAVDDLQKVKSLSPKHDQIGFLLGRTLADKGDFGQAEIELTRFLESSRNTVQAQATLAHVLHAQRKHLAAVKIYNQLIALQNPPLPEQYLNRADALVQAGDIYLDEALTGIEEGIVQLGPLVVLQRVAIEINLRQGKPEAALRRVDEMLQNAQRKESWLLEKAKILFEMGLYKKAQEQLALAQTTIDSLPRRIRNSAAMIELSSSIESLLNPQTQ